MRILTVRQPWAWAIIHGGKDVENRVRNIAGTYRGPVAIHVAKADADNAPESLWLDHADYYRRRSGKTLAEFSWRDTDRGFIIGAVDLSDVHPVANPHFHPICHDLKRPDGLREAAERGDGACSTWALPNGQWHLVFANPKALPGPIPYKGALGLRTLPDDVAASVWMQIGGKP